jgi:hypothetical protein
MNPNFILYFQQFILYLIQQFILFIPNYPQIFVLDDPLPVRSIGILTGEHRMEQPRRGLSAGRDISVLSSVVDVRLGLP